MQTMSMGKGKAIIYWKAMISLTVLLALCCLPGSIIAQRTTATLFGSVADSTGAVVSGASVTITNVETGISTTQITTGAGEYRFDLVPVGTYSVTVTAKTFAKFVQPIVPLTVNQELQLNVPLTLGAAEEQITVTAAPPQLDLESATVEKTLESREVDNLPILDRDIYNLLTTIPGVQNNQVGSDALGFNQQVLQLNGGTTADNTGTVSYYLDGGLNMTALRMTGNDMPNPEAIAEFNVQASNYDATYGRMSSGVVTALTKSGTNTFHGSAFEFNRNTDFDASNSIINPVKVTNTSGVTSVITPVVHRNMFGVTIGGPIRRDKAFFFGEYSGVRQIKPSLYSGSVLPTTTGGTTGTGEAGGDFSDLLTNKTLTVNTTKPFSQCSATVICNPATGIPYMNASGYASNIITSPIDPTAGNIMKYVNGFANTTLKGLPSFSGAVPAPYNSDEFLAKVEYQLGTKHRLVASYFNVTGNTNVPEGTSVPWVTQTQNWVERLSNLSDTYTLNSRMINQTWFTYSQLVGSRANTINMGKSGRESLAALGSNIAVQGPPSLSQIAVTGFFTLSNAIDGPEAGTDFYSARDLFILNKGTHAFTFGGELSLNKDVQVTDLNNYGVFTFSSSTKARSGNALADFYLGLPGTQTQDQPVTAIDNSFFYSLFAQDNWRLRPNLTVNLGVRWDVQTAPTDPQDKESTFVPGQQSKVNPNMPQGELVPGDSGITRGTIPNNFKHFSPRVGLAWDPFGKGKTSVRASGGVFWGSISGNEWNASSNYYPFSLRYTFPSQGSLTNPYCANGITTGCVSDSPFPFTYTSGAVNPIPSNGTIFGASPNFVWPSTYQVTASVQQQLTKGAAVSVAYVGALSRHLPMSVDENYPVFNTTTPTANTAATVLSRRPNYNAATVNTAGQKTQLLGIAYETNSNQTSNYNALQVTFSQQVTKGVSFNGFYTFSKNLDSGVLNSSTPSSTSAEEDYDNLKVDKGNDDFDQRHVFSMSIIWESNYIDKSKKLLANALNGWHVSSIINLHTGTPFNILTGSDNNQDGNTTDRPNLAAGANPFNTGTNRKSRSTLAADYFVANTPANTNIFWTPSPSQPTAPTGYVYCGYATAYPTACAGIGPGGSDGSLRRMNYYSPGYRDVDASLFRDFSIYDLIKLQARAEASNVFNLVSLGAPNATLSSSAAGTITSASGMREIQLGLRLTF
ncbi:MAG: carboxypeptidase regulatory-like domain-containing protein [Terracidiphilus sp.]